MFLLADMGIGIIIQLTLMAVAIGLSVAASYMLRPKTKSPVSAAGPVTQVTRGAYICYVIGRRRIAPVVAWIGGRGLYPGPKVGGKGFGGGGGKSQGIYYEFGWHLLCVGPAKKLHRIWENGKVVWEGPIDSTTSPSGTQVQAQPAGIFTIYWGEPDQDENTFLGDASRVGVTSRWPHFCYVLWNKRLGTTPSWQILEYEIETEVQNAVLTLTEQELDASTTAEPDVIGINPAHAIAQLLFAPYPHGLSLDQSEFDIDCLENLGELCEAEGLCGAYIATEGDEIKALLATILQDVGFLMPWDPSIGKFTFQPIRAGQEGPTLPEATILDPKTEIETVLVESPADQLIFSFSDRAFNYRPMTLVLADDGQASRVDYVKAHKVDITTVVQFEVARKVADRRALEELARGAKFTIYASRWARLMYPGMPFRIEGFSEPLRIIEVGMTPESDKVTITASVDFYGAPTRATIPTAPTAAVTGQTFTVLADLAAQILEIPEHLLQGTRTPRIAVPRIRANRQQIAGTLWLSADNVTYEEVGVDQDVQTGGVLTENFLAADGPFCVEDGPAFTILGEDADQILDLSADHAAWRRGRQLALIGDELFYLRNVENLGGGSYRLHGLIRARYDTERELHLADDKVFVFQPDRVLTVVSAILIPGRTIYAKTQPNGMSSTLDLADITAISKTLYGKGIRPMRAGALRLTTQVETYRSGEDLPLTWGYRSAIYPRSGAGLQGAGEVAPASPVDSQFLVRFATTPDPGPVVLKREVVVSTNSYTYSNADLIADFGSEQDVLVSVRAKRGGLLSNPIYLTISLV